MSSFNNLIAIKLRHGEFAIVAQLWDARDFERPDASLLRDVCEDPGYRDLAGIFPRSEMIKLATNASAREWLKGPAKEALYFLFIQADAVESGLSD